MDKYIGWLLFAVVLGQIGYGASIIYEHYNESFLITADDGAYSCKRVK